MRAPLLFWRAVCVKMLNKSFLAPAGCGMNNRAQRKRPPGEAASNRVVRRRYLSCVEIEVNLVLRPVPTPLTTVIMATEMPAAGVNFE
jgi:hypothetical protein